MGTVCIALAETGQSVRVRRFCFPGERDRVKFQASQAALDMLQAGPAQGRDRTERGCSVGSHRLFVAVELPAPVRATPWRTRDGSGVGGSAPAGDAVRWVPPEQLHITLQFLGDVDDGDTDRVKERRSPAAGRSRAFEVALGEPGVFPLRGGTHGCSGSVCPAVATPRSRGSWPRRAPG